MNINPFLMTDGYKTGHHKMYPKGTTLVYSNFTPRHGKHSNIKGGKGVISFGQQMVMRQIKEMFDKNFFMKEAVQDLSTKLSFLDVAQDKLDIKPYRKLSKKAIKKEVCQEIKKEYSMYLNTDYDVSHIKALWDLGYLPLTVKALPEGTFVPYGVPVLTIVNTKPEFFWLTNFLETMISNMLWMPMTAATTAYEYKKILNKACLETDAKSIDFVDFQGHNFGMRGMPGLDATIYSGLGHATSFKGDDSLPTIFAARKYYDEKGFVVGSVNATEHSVMCAGGDMNEIDTIRYLMKKFPTGILSIVLDTWDLTKVVKPVEGGTLMLLKEEILARDGKIVVRPDSCPKGRTPQDMICGHSDKLTDRELAANYPKFYNKGLIQCLYEIFGGTKNAQGYITLDPHIGAIYGDSITLVRAQNTCDRLKEAKFATTQWIAGIGSYTYQYVTRDTHGFAMKATYCEIEYKNDKGGVLTDQREIFKDPITDDGGKKSAKGLLMVGENMESKNYALLDQVTWDGEDTGFLQTIFKNGKFFNETTLTEIRERLNK